MKTIKAALAAAAILLAATPGTAADFSFTGTFTQDDNVQLFQFVVGATSNVTLRTWSYAGGVNAQGTAIAGGGFDPILALFDNSGAFINQNDDGGCGNVAVANTGRCWDTFLTATLGPGTYTVSVMQFDNFANGPNLANGFVRDGQGNFVGGFVDVSGSAFSQRDGHWAFDILNVEEAVTTGPSVPEPASWAMMIAGLGLAGAAMRRRARVTYSPA